MYCEWCGQEVGSHDLRCPKNPFHPDRKEGRFVYANPSDRRYCPRCGALRPNCQCAARSPSHTGEDS